jgi:hypothetical protein
MGEKTDTHRALVAKSGGKRLSGRSEHRREVCVCFAVV